MKLNKVRYLALTLTIASTSVLATPETVSANQHREAPSIYECYQYSPRLYRGVTRQAGCVVATQRLLRAAHENVGISIDGLFGPQTERHVKWFQGRRGRRATGVVNDTTWLDFMWWCLADSLHDNVCRDHTRY